MDNTILGDLLLEGDELNDGPVRGVIVRRWPPGSQDWRWIRLTIETDNGRQQVVHLLREARYYAHRRTTLPDDLATTPEFAIEEARRQADHSQ